MNEIRATRNLLSAFFRQTPRRPLLMLAVLGLGLSGYGSAATPQLQASVQVTGAWSARVTVKTGLPDGAWLQASLRPVEARPNDPALGTLWVGARVSKGQATLLLDQRQASTSIPRGAYQVLVVYSSFLDQNAAAARSGFTKSLSVLVPINLRGDGRSYAAVIAGIRRLDQFTQGFGFDETKRWTLDSAVKAFGAGQEIKGHPLQTSETRAFYFSAVDALFEFDRNGRFRTMWSGPHYR